MFNLFGNSLCPAVSKKTTVIRLSTNLILDHNFSHSGDEFPSFWQKNEDHLIFPHINTNSFRNKFHLLVQGITHNADVFIKNQD